MFGNKECLKCKHSAVTRFELTQKMPYDERILLALTEVAVRRQLIDCNEPCTLYGEYKRMRVKVLGTSE